MKSTPSLRFSQREKLLLAGLLLLAIGLRFLSFFALVDHTLYFPKYISLAERLVANGWVTPYVYAYSPLYQYFIGFILALFSAKEAVLVVQMLLGVVNTILIYAIARQSFGRAAAVASALLAVGYGTFVFYEAEFLSETPVITLNLLAAGSLFLWQSRNERHRWLILAGVFTGLSIIARPNFILFLFLFALFLLSKSWKKRTWRTAGTGILAFVLPAIFCILPITLQNYLGSKDFILVIAEGGYVFHSSNNSNAKPINYSPSPLQIHLESTKLQFDQSGRTWDEFISRKIASVTEGKELSPSQASRFWHAQAQKEMALQPWRAIWNIVQKMYYFFHGFEAHDTYSLTLKSEAFYAFPWLPFGVIAPLAILGMGLALRYWKGHRSLLLFLALLIATYFATCAALYVVPRFRLPSIPFLILFAGYALVQAASLLRSGRFRSIVPVVAGAILLFTALNWPTALIKEKRDIEIPAFVHKMRAIEYIKQGQLQRAEREYRESLTFATGNVKKGVLMDLADLYEKGGKPRLAEQARLEAMRPEPLIPGEESHYARAVREWSMGRKEKAFAELRLAIIEEPFNPFIPKSYGDLVFQGQHGSPQEAIKYYKLSLDRGLWAQMDAPAVYGNLAECYRRIGDEKASKKYEKKQKAFSLAEIKKW